jgi:hypothetical protein
VAKYLGEEMIRTRQAHRIEVHPGVRKDSVYGAARLWVDKATGALLRMEGYDWNGRLTKRFEVVGVQRIQGQWFLRTMRIENLDPATRKVLDRTYLDVLGVDDSRAANSETREKSPQKLPLGRLRPPAISLGLRVELLQDRTMLAAVIAAPGHSKT